MKSTREHIELAAWAGRGLLSAALVLALGGVASADNDESLDRGEHSQHDRFFFPDNLVVTRSVYDNNPKNVAAPQLRRDHGRVFRSERRSERWFLPDCVEQRHL